MIFTDIGADYITASMPVNHTTHQPMGLLHGGASAALAETVGSVAGWLCINKEKQNCVGLELNCNHIKGKRDGTVYATARPLHIGGSTQVWDIRILDEQDKLICVSRLTIAVIRKIAP
jgi:1,4-dihydroxy-2-naphthoyl-CoA hydrolase